MKKIGTFQGILYLICCVVGIGIFFKNSSIFKFNGNNGLGIIFSWLLGSLIAISFAICFARIIIKSNEKTISNSGFTDWCKTLCPNWMFSFSKFFIPALYFVFMTFVINFFLVDTLTNVFIVNIGQPATDFFWKNHTWFVVLLSLLLSVSFGVFNTLSKKGLILSSIGTIFKFFPILLVSIWGLIYAMIYGKHVCFQFGYNDGAGFSVNSSIIFPAIMTSLPPILFSFNGFLGVGSIASNFSEPKKQIPKTMFYGMLTCIILCLIVTLPQLLLGKGDIISQINEISGNNNVIVTLIILLLVIVLFFSGNALSIGSINSIETGINNNDCAFSYNLKKLNNPKKAAFIYYCSILLFITLLLGVITIITKSDQFVDIASNTAVVLCYTLYGFLVFFSLLDDIKQKQATFFNIVFSILCIISSFGSVGYMLIYDFGIYAFCTKPNDLSQFGLFGVDDKTKMKNWTSGVYFWILMVVLILIPILNQIILNIQNKKIK